MALRTSREHPLCSAAPRFFAEVALALSAALASGIGCGPAPAAQGAVHVPDAPPAGTADVASAESAADDANDDEAAPARGVVTSSASGKLSPQERNSRTKEIYKRGVAAQEAGRYKEAIELYHQANRLVEGAMPKFKIAQCLEALGELDQAKRYYEIFIAEAPATGSYPEKVETARQRVDVLNQTKASPKAATPAP